MSEAEIPSTAIAGAVGAAKALLRLEGAGEDGLVARLCATAIVLAEAFVGQRLIVRSFADRVAGDGLWHRLVSEPVVALASPDDGVAVDIDAHGVGWVRSGAPATEAVTVAYSAGVAATWEALPPALAQGIALLAVHLFEHREGDATPPAAIAALWRPWRRVRLAGERR